jgi:two-component system sensor histidine kinase BaeS
MTRSLTFKLTLAFLCVGLIGAVLSAFLIQQRTQTEFGQFLFDQNSADLATTLAQYYQESGNWDNVATVMPQWLNNRSTWGSHPPSNSSPSDTTPPPVRRVFYFVVDQSGTIVYGSPDRIGQPAPSDYQKGLPIEADGKNVGWLVSARPDTPWGNESPEGIFLASVNRVSLISAIISVLIALVLGAFLARTLTRPIRELTTATQVIAQGDLGVQVEVRSKDELGNLASSFNTMSSDLAKSNLIRRQMTADIAHDLRTPLSVILGYTEALADQKLVGTTEIYEVMHHEAGHLQHLIDDLRTLSLADAGELSLNMQPVSPVVQLNHTAAALRPRAKQKNIEITVFVAENLPLVRVDPERLAQVLGNLVNNALRYTPAGGTIELSASSDDQYVYLRVRDTGVGIDPDELPNVFNRFYRGNKSRQQNGETGLGLAIARSLVEVQGGVISVQSQLGQGTIFTIRFNR